MVAVLKEADEQGISTFGGTWHSDFSFLDQPPSLTLLYALELPEVGGEPLGFLADVPDVVNPDWHVEPDETPEAVFDLYRDEIRHADEIIAAIDPEGW